MLLSPVFGREGRIAWDNMVVYEDGCFYAFFGTGTRRTDGLPSVANGIDVYHSHDGLHFECIAENTCPIPTAMAGYCFHKNRGMVVLLPHLHRQRKGRTFQNLPHPGFPCLGTSGR